MIKCRKHADLAGSVVLADCPVMQNVGRQLSRTQTIARDILVGVLCRKLIAEFA